MISYLKLIVGLGLCIAVLFAVIRYGAGSLLPPVSTTPKAATATTTDTRLFGKRAPYFDLPNLAGDRTTLSDYENEPLVILFWSTGNSDAADQIKILDDLNATEGAHSLVQVLTIATLEEKSAVASFMRRGGYKVTVVTDTNGSVGESYLIKNLPTLFFLDRYGLIRGVHAGAMSQKAIAQEIESILR